MIVVDPLFDTSAFTSETTPRCFRNTQACHMMSTLPGAEGLTELVAFARKLGLSPSWVQDPWTPRQHFDLVASKRAAAIRLGATEVDAVFAPWLDQQPVEKEAP